MDTLDHLITTLFATLSDSTEVCVLIPQTPIPEGDTFLWKEYGRKGISAEETLMRLTSIVREWGERVKNKARTPEAKLGMLSLMGDYGDVIQELKAIIAAAQK